MNIKELKEYIQYLPDDTLVGILDTNTDDMFDSSYAVNKNSLHIGEYCNLDEEIKGKCLWFEFENRFTE